MTVDEISKDINEPSKLVKKCNRKIIEIRRY